MQPYLNQLIWNKLTSREEALGEHKGVDQTTWQIWGKFKTQQILQKKQQKKLITGLLL